MTEKNPEISIIIRTCNEERWIAHCLRSIFSQTFRNFEVVIVDNCSKDNTTEIAKRFPIAAIVKIKNFLPGKAINDGVRASSGNFIVCISAHCIPKDNTWLSALYYSLKDNQEFAGSYGRQLPLPFTSDADKRDLLITFGNDKKIQINDCFFHNANSILSRKIWEKFPFDENVKHIEDRIWGKSVIEAGYKILYEPEAQVYHYHGLHQHGSSSERARGIVNILDKLDQDGIDSLPETLKPENINIASIIIVKDNLEINSIEFKSLSNVVEEIKKSQYINSTYILTYDKKLSNLLGVGWLDKNKSKFDDDTNVENLLSVGLAEIELTGCYPEIIVYVNHFYPFRPKKIFDELINELQYKGLSAVFTGFADYGHYYKVKKETFLQVDSSMRSRNSRKPLIRALYGLACATNSADIRQKSITGKNVGIKLIEDYKYTFNFRENGMHEIIEKLL